MIVRQGDVLLRRIDRLPAGLVVKPREAGRVILAHGEVTGHHHSLAEIEVEQLAADGITALDVRAALAQLEHQEHATVTLLRGTYEVIRQVEYTPEAIRRVAD